MPDETLVWNVSLTEYDVFDGHRLVLIENESLQSNRSMILWTDVSGSDPFVRFRQH